jgi:putative ABC transport system permease protein
VSNSSIQSQRNGATPVGEASHPPARSLPLPSILEELRLRKRRRGLFSVAGANFAIALEALWINRLRTFLTVLGIFIGIAAVIAALILTQGAQVYINNQLEGRANSVVISGGSANKGGTFQGGGSLGSLTLNDVTSLEHIPHVISASPLITTSDEAIYGRESSLTTIAGVSKDYLTIKNFQVAQGTWFSSDDATLGTKVAVLGSTVWHDLFDASGHNPVGQQIRIRNTIFRVVGVLAAQGGFFSQDNAIYIPFKTAKERLKNVPDVDQIQVQVDTTNNVDQVAQAITDVLRQNHRLTTHRQNDFAVNTFNQVLQQAWQGSLVLEILLIGIAAISLTVGGIGIMNIMLVSVTERTWEIGIRMAMGARRRDIRNQFLIEALMLCFIGGLVGLLLGLLVGRLVVNASGTLPFVVTTTTFVLPFAVSSAIAIIFGLYPAIQASRLDPIVAIRIEE